MPKILLPDWHYKLKRLFVDKLLLKGNPAVRLEAEVLNLWEGSQDCTIVILVFQYRYNHFKTHVQKQFCQGSFLLEKFSGNKLLLWNSIMCENKRNTIGNYFSESKYWILFPTLFCFIMLFSQNSFATNSDNNQDWETLSEALDILSNGWDQSSVDEANEILSNERYGESDWKEFFQEYFAERPLTNDLKEYLVYPVFYWFSDESHGNLQQGITHPLLALLDNIMDINQSEYELANELDTDKDKRETVINAHKFMNNIFNVGVDSVELRTDIFQFYKTHIDTFSYIFKQSVTLDTNDLFYLATIRGQIYMNLRDAFRVMSITKEEISEIIGLKSPELSKYLEIWNNYGVMIIDNNGLNDDQLSTVDNLLSHVSQELIAPNDSQALGTITVDELIGNVDDKYISFEQTTGVNVFDLDVGVYEENSFPDDVAPSYTDQFALVLIHELNHIVDDVYNEQDEERNDFKEDLNTSTEGNHEDYLRSMFEDGYFVDYPQEFFASISNQYLSNTGNTFKLAMARFANGVREPMDQFVFFAETYSLGDDFTVFYKTDTLGNVERSEVPITRNEEGGIGGIHIDGIYYEFSFDEDGKVDDVRML